MVNVITDERVRMDALKGKTIAVIGYGSQGRAQALCMKESGLKVIAGLREGGDSWKLARQDGVQVMSIADAAAKGDIIHILIPDECQKDVYDQHIKQHVKPGKTLSFSHGFNIVFGQIVPPEGIDVIMIAPKSPGTEERKRYLEGFGVPALIAVKSNASGKAREVALAMAKAMRFTRAGVLECTFEQETYEDLFGEQAVLCGGLVELIKAGFETLVEAGYPPEMAYFECVHEMKLIIDLVYEGGIKHMADVVSNTAEYGMWSEGHKIITGEVKKKMKETLKRVESGEFAAEWIKEYENGMPRLKEARERISKHEIETVGTNIRKMFKRK